jgi:DNA mismatch repair ATPase MutS
MMFSGSRDTTVNYDYRTNMSGKSAILRQAALVYFLKTNGKFVPAESLRMGIVDKIFTRVGASDNISMEVYFYG